MKPVVLLFFQGMSFIILINNLRNVNSNHLDIFEILLLALSLGFLIQCLSVWPKLALNSRPSNSASQSWHQATTPSLYTLVF